MWIEGVRIKMVWKNALMGRGDAYKIQEMYINMAYVDS